MGPVSRCEPSKELPIPLLSTLEHVLSKVIASHTSYSLSQRRNISIAIQGLVTKCGGTLCGWRPGTNQSTLANAYGLLAQESLLLMLMEMLRVYHFPRCVTLEVMIA